MSNNWNNGQEQDDEEDPTTMDNPGYKKNNVLPLWGNERTMNMNPLVLTNIQGSHYFKTNLYGLKTYHEVLDEVYYKVQHLEPWEKGSRKTSGQTGMCGGVRGVGAGGIVSTAYCLLYKLFTLKMTRKQLNGLINHTDSPYIRALGFMYIRYTQPPPDLWNWYEPYIEDEEELDVKAGGGQVMTIGNMLRSFLTKLEWHGTLFPRIPVPIQQKLEKQMSARFPPVYSQPNTGGNYGGGNYRGGGQVSGREARHIPDSEAFYGEAERQAKTSGYGQDRRDQDSRRERSRGYESNDWSKPSGSRDRYASPERKKYRDDRDGYKDRDKYSSKHDKYTKDDKYKRDDKYKEDRRKDDKYSKEDRYSSRDKYSSSRHNHNRDRSRSPKHRRY